MREPPPLIPDVDKLIEGKSYMGEKQGDGKECTIAKMMTEIDRVYAHHEYFMQYLSKKQRIILSR